MESEFRQVSGKMIPFRPFMILWLPNWSPMAKPGHRLSKKWRMPWMTTKLWAWKTIWSSWKEFSKILFSIREIMILASFKTILILSFTRTKSQLLRRLLLLFVEIITNVKMFNYLLNYSTSEMLRVKKNITKFQLMRHLSKKLITKMLLYKWPKKIKVLLIVKERILMWLSTRSLQMFLNLRLAVRQEISSILLMVTPSIFKI